MEEAGALVAARSAAAMATPAVVVANRARQRRRVIQIGIVMFVVGAVVTAATNVFVGALVGFALMGLGKAVFDVSGQAYLADRTSYEVRARYLGLFEVTWAGGFLIGAPVAGFLIDRFGWEAAFWFTATLAAVAVLASTRLLDIDSGAAGERGALRFDRSGAALITAAGLLSAASEFVAVVLGAWLEDAFAIALGAIAGLAALIGIAELSGSSLTALITDRLGKRRAVIVGLIVAAFGYAGMGLAQNQLVLGIVMAAIAFAGFEFTIVSTFPLASEAAPHARARFLAWLVVTINAGRTVAAFLGTRLFVAVGFGANVALAIGLNMVAIGLMVALVREAEPTQVLDSTD